MPGGSLPVPNDILALAEDYNAALKDVERNIRSVERDIVKTLKKEGDITSLLAKKKELEVTRSTVVTGQQEQAFTKRVDRIITERNKRFVTQMKYGRSDIGNLKDMIDLSRGQITGRNLAGAGELAKKLSQSGLRAGVSGLASAGLSAASTFLPAAVFMASMENLLAQYELGDNVSKQTLKSEKFFKEFARKNRLDPVELQDAINSVAAKEAARSAPFENILGSTAGRGKRSFSELVKGAANVKDEIKKDIDTAMDNPELVAALVNWGIGRDKTGYSQTDRGAAAALQDMLADPTKFGNRDVAKIAEQVKAFKKKAAEQREFFETDPKMAEQYHEQRVQGRFVEREKYFSSVRAW
jgi:hypothetical protein